MSPRPNRAIIAGAYAVALLLVLVPLSEMTLRVWPLRLGEPAWRFGAVGLFSNALLTPLLGIAFAGTLAFIYGHRRTIRTLAVALGLATLVLAAAGGMFILDALQMRASVVPDAKLAFDVASAQALIKITIFGAVAFLLAIGGWRASRRHPAASRAATRIVRMPRDTAPDSATPASAVVAGKDA